MKKIVLILLFLSITAACLAKDIVKETNKQLYKTTLGEDNDEVIIGDEKKTDIFKSKVTFTKWHKEESFSIVYNKTFSGIPVLREDIYSIDGSKEKFYFKVNPDDDNEFKFGLILKEKPLSNKFTYQLENWENFDFFYQYEDMTDWMKHPEIFVSENEKEARLLIDGVEYIVYKKYWKGYSVYHKTKHGYLEGETNYKIGKVGDFIRPIFIDADGKSEIAELNIKDGVYTVTISQAFLDNAKYPVIMNDTFGQTSAPTGSGHSINGGTYALGRYQLTVNGTVTKHTAYVENESASDYPYYSGLYNDVDGNYPSVRVIAPGSVTITTQWVWAWLDVNVVDTALSAAYYWFGSYSSNANVKIRYDGWGQTVYTSGDYTNHPNPFPDGKGSVERRYGLYATYTPSGGAPLETIRSAQV